MFLSCSGLHFARKVAEAPGQRVPNTAARRSFSDLSCPVPEDVILTDLARDFRTLCFAINPEDRPTAAVLRKHPYLTLAPGWFFTGFGSGGN